MVRCLVWLLALLVPSLVLAQNIPVNGNLVVSGTTTGALQDKGGAAYNVKAYGAVGDGVTNDRAAIQAAIDAAKDTIQYPDEGAGFQAAGIIEIPAGVYLLDVPLQLFSGQTLRGVGPGSHLKAAAGFTGTTLIQLSPASGGFYLSHVTDLQLTSAATAAIAIATNTFVNSCTFERLTINAKYGLQLHYYTQNTHIDRLYALAGVEQILQLRGNFNRVRNINKEGGPAGTTTDPYILVGTSTYGGVARGNLLEAILIEGSGSSLKTPIVLNGTADTTLRHLWFEPLATEGYALRIQNSVGVTTVLDFITELDATKFKIQVATTHEVYFNHLNVTPGEVPWTSSLDVDSTSHVTIGTLVSTYGQSLSLLSKLPNVRIVESYATSLRPALPSEPVTQAPRTGSAANILTNPSFESSGTGWTVTVTPTTAEYIASEVGPGLMAHYVWSTAQSSVNVRQPVVVPAGWVGKPLTLSALVRITTSGGNAQPYVDGAGIVTWIQNGVLGGTGWAIVQQTVVPQYADTMQVGIQAHNVTDLAIDGVSLVFGTEGMVGLPADPTTAITGPIRDRGGQVYNVKAYGAMGNGTTNDTTAVNAAYAAAGATGGILYFPPGTYLLSSITLNQANVTWQGAGMYVSVLKAAASGNLLVGTPPGTNTLVNPTLEDVGLDGGGFSPATGIADDLGRIGLLTVRRCRFTRLNYGMSLWAGDVVIDGNLFEGTGDGTFGTSIQLGGPFTHATITNNRFRYVYNGLLGDTATSSSVNENPITDVEYSHNFHDLGFYTTRARMTNSGGTVTYTATTLNDSAASFSGFTASDFIRILATRRTGTATMGWTEVTDASATFLTSGVLPGEIVRAGGKFGIVMAVESETVLHVEEWLSETDRTIVGSPVSGPYTVYSVVLGKYVSHTATSVTVARWTTLNGTTVTPTAGTLYEIIAPHPNYPLNCESGCQNWRITDNTFLRGWSDQLSTFGTKSLIANNYLAWGQDMGITVGGTYNTVTANRIDHQGAGGISVFGASDSTVSHNSITNTTWENAVNTTTLGGIMIAGARNIILGNVVGIDATMPLARHGITLGSASVDRTMLLGNMTRGHGVGGVRLDSAGGCPTLTRKSGNVSTSEPAESIAAGCGFVDGEVKVLTDNTAIPIVSASLANGSVHASQYRYAVTVTNGTDYQLEEGQVSCRATNKAGTIANNACTKLGNQQAVTAGTLSVTFAISAANPAVISVNADSSLTPSAGSPLLVYTPVNLTGQAFALQ